MATSDDPEPRAVSVSILKGGVGKSTVSVNLADALARRGHRVLFIDLDPNGHASVGLGLEDAYHAEADIGDVILDEGDATLKDLIRDTAAADFDILPSSENLEAVERSLNNQRFPDVRIKRHVVGPLLGEVYDYIVTDSPAYRGRLSDNALIATTNQILPLTPGNEALAGLTRTIERQIKPLREAIGLEILAITPNRMSKRIDQQNKDRKLVQGLNSTDAFRQFVPSYARLTDEDFDRIDSGDYPTLPKPGIRERDAFTQAFESGEPLSAFDPDNDQLACFDELARIVERGEVRRAQPAGGIA